MRDIVRVGLNYIVALDHAFQNVVLMQHSRVDIFYLMVGILVEGDLTQVVFDSEESYTITYYDNPLQPGITPMWSDQNVLGSRKAKVKNLPRKELNFEEFQRRQKHALFMLENGPPDPMIALEEKYRGRMLATEHERRVMAISGQDIYENDAEMDLNDYADFLESKSRNAGDTAEASGGVDPSTAGGDAELTFSHDSSAERYGGPSSGDTTVMKYASQGAEKVLGLSSDGVLFVAHGGKVLRNEGPPKPPCESAQRSRSLERSHRFPFNFHGCSCWQLSFNFRSR